MLLLDQLLKQYYVTELCPGVGLYIAQISLTLIDHKACREIPINASGTDVSESKAILKCQMELLERLFSVAPTALTVHSANVVSAIDRLEWWQFAPYSSISVSRMEASCGQADEYCIGHGLISRKRYAVSAGAVAPSIYLQRFDRGSRPEIDGSGLAAGFRSERKVIVSRALCEVVERDTAMLSWRVIGWPTRPVDDMLSTEIGKVADALSLRVFGFEITGPTHLPTVIAMACKRDGSKLTCGTCCHPSLAKAIEKAALEALSIRTTGEYSVDKCRGRSELIDSLDHINFAYTNGPMVLDWYCRQSSYHRCPYPKSENHHPLLSTYEHEPVVIRLVGRELDLAGYQVYRVLIPHACRKEWSHKRAFLDCPRLAHFLTVCGQGLNPSPHPFG